MKPGIYEMSAASYHQDPCERPSLSASIAKLLCSATPLHAWTAHPLLNPRYQRQEDEKFDVGIASHALLLEGGWKGVEVFADDWRTKAAREARDEIRASGRVPLLSKDYARVLEMVTVAREQLDAHTADPPLFSDGVPEHTIIWQEGDILCRAKPDWLRNDCRAVDDLKTTSRSADPKAWERRLYDHGNDLQAAMYLRGLKALTGVDAKWRWVIVETAPPYGLSVVEPGADVLAVGEAKVEFAIRLWRECLESGVWPAYSSEVYRAELPAWADDAKWLVDDYKAVA